MNLRRIRAVSRAVFPIAFMSALFLYALWPWLPFHDDTRSRRTIVFYGFSILEAPIVERIFPGFRKAWKDSTATRSPTVRPRTSCPMASTLPQPSCPGAPGSSG